MSALLGIIEKSLGECLSKFSIESTKVERWIKDEAKKLFFSGNINQLILFLQKEDAVNSDFGADWQRRLKDDFPLIPDDFIVKMHYFIRESLPKEEPISISSLLDILDYSHLEGFIKMFGI